MFELISYISILLIFGIFIFSGFRKAEEIINFLKVLKSEPSRFLSLTILGFLVAFGINIWLVNEPASEEKSIIYLHAAARFVPEIIIGVTVSFLVAGITNILVEDIILDKPRKDLLKLLTGNTQKQKFLIVLPAFVIPLESQKKFQNQSKDTLGMYQPGLCCGNDREDYTNVPDWAMLSGSDLTGAASLISRIMELRLSDYPVEIWFDDPYKSSEKGTIHQSIFARSVKFENIDNNNEAKNINICKELKLTDKISSGGYVIISVGLRSNELANFVFNQRHRDREGDQKSDENRNLEWVTVLNKKSLGKYSSLKDLCPPPYQNEQEEEKGLIARVNLPSRLIHGKNEDDFSNNVIFLIGGSAPEATARICRYITRAENSKAVLDYKDNVSNKKVGDDGVNSFYVLFEDLEAANSNVAFADAITAVQ